MIILDVFSLTIILDVFSLLILTLLHFSWVGKPVLDRKALKEGCCERKWAQMSVFKRED